MNDIETPNPIVDPQMPQIEKPKTTDKHWWLILALMITCLVVSLYVIYGEAISLYLRGPDMTINVQTNSKENLPVQQMETSGSVEQDSTMATDKVTEDILKELDDVEKTDASTTFNTNQVDDLE